MAPVSRRWLGRGGGGDLLGRVLLLALGALVALCLAEILVRGAAAVRPDVRFLATAGRRELPDSFESLEDLLFEYRDHLQPHRLWNNHYANALGFTDEEFTVEKAPAALRIMALGDSFAYGMVGYPDNVLTLVEERLARECPGLAAEVMNFGIPAAGLAEYRLLHQLAAPRFRPDRVVVHFYLGNDGPDLVFRTGRRPSPSRAWTLLVNSLRLLRGVERLAAAAAPPPADGSPAHPARGGARASDAPDVADDDLEPSFSEEAFAAIASAELVRFYHAEGSAEAWRATLALLDALAADARATTGHGPLVVLYPSSLQLDPQRVAAAERYLRKRRPDLDFARFDLAHPSRVLLDHCRRTGLACHDLTPALRGAAQASAAPLYRPRDTHWNVRGNRAAAAAEAEFLGRELCPGTRAARPAPPPA
jgi:hypothetical protein